MTKEAELNARRTKNRREEVEARNQLDSVIYQLEKTIKDTGEQNFGGREIEDRGGVWSAPRRI